MANGFEEARHQGFSRADMAQEMAEKEKRMKQLGCDVCVYKYSGFMTCDTVIEICDTLDGICPSFKKRGGQT